MDKIAVMGDRDSIYGFGALGMSVFPETDPEQAKKQLRQLVKGGYAVIYITEALAEQIEEEIQKYAVQPLPAIILIPGASGNTGKGLSSVSRSVEQAVGFNILGEDTEENDK